jgi:hypothetical protein
MMAKDPALKADFERRLREDAAFAASPSQRLFYFFERSPWYSAQNVGLYPVYRIDASTLQGLAP